MQTDAYRQWSTRIVTFVISALAASSAAYWGLKGWGPDRAAPPASVIVAPGIALSPEALARALGGGAAPVAQEAAAPLAAKRYALLGVVAGRLRPGAALIAVDDQEAQPVRVGSLVDEGILLESVSARKAILVSTEDASVKFTLELPELAE